MKKKKLKKRLKSLEDRVKALENPTILVPYTTTNIETQPCLHDSADWKEGDIHMISCPCPKCSPYSCVTEVSQP